MDPAIAGNLEDLEEFMTLAENSGKVGPSQRQRALEKTSHPDPEPEVQQGKPTQWSIVGKGYSPCPRTVKRIEPGAYKTQFKPNIGLHIERQNITTDSLIRLPDSMSDFVISEIERFWTLKDKFTKFGFTHKRGFLLWGPPGSGKTCTIAFVIQQTIASGGLVFLMDQPMPLAAAMQDLRLIEPDRKLVVVMEDLDTIIQRHGEAETLAILDGESSIDNVMFIATTNYPQNLDGRITNRPSRFDRVVKIGMPSAEARKIYLESRGVEGDISNWVELTKGLSIAHIKELIVCVCCFGEKLEDTVNRLQRMAKTPRSDQGGTIGFGDFDRGA